MDAQELLTTAARALGVYALMLLVIRALGKRTVGNFAAFDLLVALMLGEVVDEIIYGDVSFAQGFTAVAAIGLAQWGNAWVSANVPGADKILEGQPTPIIRDGRLLPDAMKRERMNARDVMAHLRESGVQDLREVHLATVEDDGRVSVMLREWAMPATRADVDAAAAKARTHDTRGREAPGAAERTDAPRYL
jgi:uncharacterized membrane protein YcaP (DUF421 family)